MNASECGRIWSNRSEGQARWWAVVRERGGCRSHTAEVCVGGVAAVVAGRGRLVEMAAAVGGGGGRAQ
jgi:hypothetical protein